MYSTVQSDASGVTTKLKHFEMLYCIVEAMKSLFLSWSLSLSMHSDDYYLKNIRVLL
jgi:hypothetical protein